MHHILRSECVFTKCILGSTPILKSCFCWPPVVSLVAFSSVIVKCDPVQWHHCWMELAGNFQPLAAEKHHFSAWCLSYSLTFHLRSVHTKVCTFDSFFSKNQACLVFVLIIQLKEFHDRPCQRSVPTVVHLTLHCDFSVKVQIDSFPLWNHFGIIWQMNP